MTSTAVQFKAPESSTVREPDEGYFLEPDEGYFREVACWKSLNHTPFLVFEPRGDGGVVLRIIRNFAALLQLPDEILVVGQWKGEYDSFYVRFTVADARRVAETDEDVQRYLALHAPKPRRR